MVKPQDWTALKFDWNRARAFLVTAEEGSLTRAAHALGMAQPTLSRQVAGLEEELGVTLFDRVPRGLRLTPAGLHLLDHMRTMGQAAERVSLAASGESQTLDGTVAVTASEIVAAHFLPNALRALREAAPGIRVEVMASNDERDLRRREADIAIRSFRPTQPDLIARKVRDVPVYLYASKAYAAKLINRDNINELSRAAFIGYDNGPALPAALRDIGLDLPDADFALTCDSHLAAWEMVRAGLGIGLMSGPVGDRDPSVVRVGAGLRGISYPLWIAAHRELQTSARMRVVFDALAHHL